MKKAWKAPLITTLDVRLTHSGTTYWPEEGTLVFRPEEGEESDIIEVSPNPS